MFLTKEGKLIRRQVELNGEFIKELRNYLALSNFLSHQYLDLVSKEEYTDKAKFKFDKSKLPKNASQEEILKEYRRQEKSARIAGMAKRMVLYPATIENFEQDKIDGVSPDINVCVVEDAQEETFNLKGSTHDQDIFDGAAFISVYYSYMENNSLPGRGIRGTKKPLGVSISDGASSLFKYAEFEINNAKIRESRGNKFDLLRVFKKMHDIQFGHEENGEFVPEDIDITRDIFGNSLENIEDILGKKIYYTKGFSNYVIRTIKKVGFNTYEFTVSPCSDNGHALQEAITTESGEKVNKDIITKFTKRINSIYDLWEALGGYNSKELIDGKLEDSEINNELIAQYIFRVGNTKAKTKESVNQSNTY